MRLYIQQSEVILCCFHSATCFTIRLFHTTPGFIDFDFLHAYNVPLHFRSGFQIFEASGKLRPSIVVYPFSALPQILTLGVGNNNVKVVHSITVDSHHLATLSLNYDTMVSKKNTTVHAGIAFNHRINLAGRRN